MKNIRKKAMLIPTLLILLAVSTVNAGMLNIEPNKSNILLNHIIITDADSSAMGWIYIPGGELQGANDSREGLYAYVYLYDEEYNVSAALSENKAIGIQLSNKKSNRFRLDHRSIQAAGHIVPLNDSAGAMGGTDTFVTFVPKSTRSFVTLEIKFEYLISAIANGSYDAQSCVMMQYWDDYNENNTKVVQSFIHLTDPGYESDNDSIVHVVEVPSGTTCHVTIATAGVTAGEESGMVTGVGYTTSDASLTVRTL